ncbi:surface lipoprotein assembly modifier [Suttonella sp. R2A3]|uniref:porin family protein n=1 Tax=Suttonella sp. R2A3 TaxID=2908648 RepID=UPI001F37FD37|nr:porin family protein [Suttonella sp. R2A3]UJF25375.1 surface lipoprotein assembly modifier [Suttonella sp. R2A3]
MTATITRILLLLTTVLNTGISYGEESVIAQRLWQESIQLRNQEQTTLLATIAANNTQSTVQNPSGVDPLIVTLFDTINQGQSVPLRQFLNEHSNRFYHNDPLWLYAQASLARLEGRTRAAEQGYRQTLDQAPDFIRARLDLAKLLFNDQQNREAQQAFGVLNAQLLPPTVRNNINLYQQALGMRERWQGSVSLGLITDNNINQSSETNQCLFSYQKVCLVERSTPAAIATSGLGYEGTLSKYWPLRGHHGLYGRGLIYGQQIPNYLTYNKTTIQLGAGYQFANATQHFSFGPIWIGHREANHQQFNGVGVAAQWRIQPNNTMAWDMYAEHKTIRYTHADYQQNNSTDNNIHVTFSTAWPEGWRSHIGFDYLRRDTDQAVNSYQQKGIRLSVDKLFAQGFMASLGGAFYEIDYNAYNALLEQTRHERKWTFNAAISAPQWQIGGFSPKLSWQRTRLNSNVDWLYSYDQDQFMLTFQRLF